MTDRWQEISRLYDAALELAEDARPVFLDNNCRGDEELRREVESLLTYERQAKQFIDRPALQVTAEKLGGEPPSLVGRRLGPYQIQVALGAGGMGEVYKAKDTRLNRTVAIKVLPRLLSERADLRQRFEREARAIASLNHSNICALYDISRQDAIDFLVMEYLEGETLSKRLKKGPLPTEQLLRTAIEIATALDQAHRHGLIHRDLKPGNIMLTKQGAKLLDFGLAKRAAREGETPGEPARGDARPPTDTESESLTEQGMLLGTLEYMAPEQVAAKETDTRTDIFALGVVIYEMATGRKAFEGDSKASLTAAILTSEPPPITKVQPMAPPALERVVKRCLAKDPEERWQSVRDLANELRWIAEAGGAIPAAAAEVAAPKLVAERRRRKQLAWALAVALLISTIVSALSYLRVVRAPAHAIISEILPPEKCQFNFVEPGPPALSPDGRSVAFSAADASGKTMLWVRRFDSPVAHRVSGTEGAANPFWSPNGQSVGFFADQKLKTVEVSGGTVVVLADAPGMFVSGSWNREGALLFVPAPTKGLYKAPSAGGAAAPLFKEDPSKVSYYGLVRFLPDGKHFLYELSTADQGASGIYFASLDGKENRLVLKGVSRAIYASGVLLYLRTTTLVGQAFDPERGQFRGDPHPVVERVAPGWCNGIFDVAENGVLVYQEDTRGERRLTWFDRAGKELSASGGGSYWSVRLSPDAARLSFDAGEWNHDIWVDDLARGVPMRLTNDPETDKGTQVWSPDGSRILFGALGGKAVHGIYQMNSDGSGGMELLVPAEHPDQIWPTSWSPDGRYILCARGNIGNPVQSIWLVPLADRKPRLFLQNAFDGQFSPDGRWVAYTSVESGEMQIDVVPFDATKVLNAAPGAATSMGGKWQISAGGGVIARWRGDGKELFYFGRPFHMIAVQVDGGGAVFKAQREQALFRLAVAPAVQYDVTPDGKRFVMTTERVNPNTPLTLVVNWTALLGNKP